VETPPQFYKICDLVLLPELNPRAQLCEETISRYMESLDALPPVSIQEGTGVLVDGFHRVEAATRLGAEVVPIRMLDIPDEELHLYAGLANCGHGRALNRAERNRFIVRLVEQYRWPVEKVARSVGVSPSSISLALREHRYNQTLSERMGEEVQVINSSHVQALYRVGAEQRAQLLDAVAGKVDEEGRPRPLTGAELKSLVDRMEDPQTPAEELKRLLADPLARPDAASRRSSRSAAAPVAAEDYREVERRGPLSDGARVIPSPEALRTQLLERATAPEDRTSASGHDRTDRDEVQMAWSEDLPPPAAGREVTQDESRLRPRWTEPAVEAPLRLDQSEGPSAPFSTGGEPALALLERAEDERSPAETLREAERLLCDLCARVEDAELWDQLRAARDLVREAVELIGS
jgi:ParB-like chromosome segregation protein Spo0J